MGDTVYRNYPYPDVSVVPDVPYDMQQLADAIDADVQGVADDIAPLLDNDWTALTLAGAWDAYVLGGGYYNGARARKVGPVIQVNGMIKSGSGTITTLPWDLRPTHSIILPVAISGSLVGFVSVSAADGVVSYLAGSPTTPSWLALNLSIPA